MKLGDLALVRSGLVLSRKQAREPTGIRYPLLNLRSVNSDGSIAREQMDVFDASEKLPLEYISQIGDIIVRLSLPYTAVLIDEATAGAVVSSNFAIIRCGDKLLPEYLFWLINTPEVRKEIYENSSSNMLGAAKARYFAEFEIDLLPIVDQRRISAMNLLAKREEHLLRQLAIAKERCYSFQIHTIYEKTKRKRETKRDKER